MSSRSRRRCIYLFSLHSAFAVYITGCCVIRKETCITQLFVNGRYQSLSFCDLLVSLLIENKFENSCSIVLVHICCCMDHASFTRWTETWVVDCTIWTYTTTAKIVVFSFSDSHSFDSTDHHICICYKCWPKATVIGRVNSKF